MGFVETFRLGLRILGLEERDACTETGRFRRRGLWSWPGTEHPTLFGMLALRRGTRPSLGIATSGWANVNVVTSSTHSCNRRLRVDWLPWLVVGTSPSTRILTPTITIADRKRPGVTPGVGRVGHDLGRTAR